MMSRLFHSPFMFLLLIPAAALLAQDEAAEVDPHVTAWRQVVEPGIRERMSPDDAEFVLGSPESTVMMSARIAAGWLCDYARAHEGSRPREGQNAQLRTRHLDCLEALRDMNAVSEDSRRKARAVAMKVHGPQGGPEQVKEPLADLRGWGYVESKAGRGGGTWLTENGLREVNNVRPPKER